MSVTFREPAARLREAEAAQAIRLVLIAQQRRRPTRRVRQEARDAMAVVAFSVGASTAVALSLTILARVAG